MLIWVEISMTGQNLFVKDFKRLRQSLCTPFEKGLRIHKITDYDFDQLPPCLEKYLFLYPATYEKEEGELDDDTKKGKKNYCSA